MAETIGYHDAAPLDGANFRARVRLSTKDDVTLALVGETCERVPISSLAGLLASRKIAPLEDVARDQIGGE